jgi:NADH-quinone oxidoreductase subunit J
MVLVLFVIMLLNLREEESRPKPLGAGRFAIGALVVLGVAWKAFSVLAATRADRPPVADSFGTVAGVSTLLFTRYVLQFEVVSILLMAVIVAVVVLAKRRA